MANIEPSIGPMHGVHPNAKVNPKKNGGRKFPLCLIAKSSRNSFCKKVSKFLQMIFQSCFSNYFRYGLMISSKDTAYFKNLSYNSKAKIK